MHLDELISALRRPEVYPDAVPPRGCGADLPRVDVVQTHASVVFLVGERAWKIKKPVNLGFLDFSTLDRRRDDCLAELALNRRIVPEVYLGLAAVVRDADGQLRVIRDPPARDSDSQAIVEWVVEMRRLPTDGMLDRLIAAGGVDRALLERFAGDLAALHARAEGGPSVSAYGAIAILEARIGDNLDRLQAHAAHGPHAPLTAAFVTRLRQRTLDWLARLEPLLDRRRSEGCVRDGHGDLHARNLCLFDGRIIAYDCLEFSPAYRCADVAMDVAFLAMDLDRLGHTELADAFVEAYRVASDDDSLCEPVRFFKLHYAIVRAMVEAIRLHESETPADDIPALRADVRSYAALAAGYAVEPATVILMGLPASGKSTLAGKLGSALRARVVNSDRTRKAMHAIEATTRADTSLYAEAISKETYAALADEVKQARGSMVIDASHCMRWQRAMSVAAATRRAGPCLVVEIEADEALTRQRLEARREDPTNVSDATIEVFELLRAGREPPTELAPNRRITVRSGDESAVLEVLAALMALRS